MRRNYGKQRNVPAAGPARTSGLPKSTAGCDERDGEHIVWLYKQKSPALNRAFR